MGKPGGFFKRLKAKQSRVAARRRRGTKGASKEERRRKQAERVEYFAARREAEQLAAISSSSSSEAGDDDVDHDNSSDDDDVDDVVLRLLPDQLRSEQLRRRQQRQQRAAKAAAAQGADRKLQRLRALLHVTPTRGDGSRRRGDGRAAASLHKDDECDGNDADDDMSDTTSTTSDESAAQPHDDDVHATTARTRHDNEDDDDSNSDAQHDDDDDDDDDELLVDEDDDAADLFAQVNGTRTTAVRNDDHDDDDEDDDEDEDEDDDEDAKEVDESDREDAYVDDDDEEEASAAPPRTAAERRQRAQLEQQRAAERAALLRLHNIAASDSQHATTTATSSSSSATRLPLQQYTPHTSSEAFVQAVTCIRADDPWLQKYHLDTHGSSNNNNNDNNNEEEDKTLTPLVLSEAALNALRSSNDDYAARAAAREAQQQQQHDDKNDDDKHGAARTRDVFAVSAEEYARLRPDNVAVSASAHARQHMLHPPFEPATTTTTRATKKAMKSKAKNNNDDDNDEEDVALTRPPYMHEALWQQWLAYCAGNDDDNDNNNNKEDSTLRSRRPPLTAEERGLLDLLQGYADVLDCTRCWQVTQSRREVLLLHMLNHWYKARSVVLAHDEQLQQRRQQQQQQRARCRAEDAAATASSSAATRRRQKKTTKTAAKRTRDDDHIVDDNNKQHEDEDAMADDDDDDDDELELRDRGFGKTRLLLVLPMRNTAYRYVHTLVRLLGADAAHCPRLSTFAHDFSEVDEAVDTRFHRRPRDYQRQFEGNIDDAFCVGLRLEPRRVHVYAHPLNSDMVICSPLGLRRRLAKSADVAVSLAAIEVCVMDEAHVLLQQNWQHVRALLSMLNARPTDTTHGLADVRRVYAWALRGASAAHRQTIVCSDLTHATLLATLRMSPNASGKVLLTHREEAGCLSQVTLPVRQHFLRCSAATLAAVDEARFDFFVHHVLRSRLLPLLERDVRVLLYVPSYFDYVRLRQYLHREHRDTYAALCEYTPAKQQRRALGQFSDLERPLLLLTERFDFFRRYYVQHAEVVVFYSPPQFAAFYVALVNRLAAASPNACAMTLYTRYDSHELHRLVGTARMRQMFEHASGIVSFVTH